VFLLDLFFLWPILITWRGKFILGISQQDSDVLLLFYDKLFLPVAMLVDLAERFVSRKGKQFDFQSFHQQEQTISALHFLSYFCLS